MSTEIFRCLAGSRLFGTNLPSSDTDYKAVHLPPRQDILLGKAKPVISRSTGAKDAANSASDVDIESFTLLRFLEMAAGMQTNAVETLFAPEMHGSDIWFEVKRNRHRIVNRNAKPFVGYCKAQAVRYSLRGERLETVEAVVNMIREYLYVGTSPFQSVRLDTFDDFREAVAAIPNVEIVQKRQPGGNVIDYLDVFGRQVPMTITAVEALKVYEKPLMDAGKRARDARDAGGADWKALYHAVRIADEGIRLFRDGELAFPCENRTLLMAIRRGEKPLEDVLDVFDEKVGELEAAVETSPLREKPDFNWMFGFVVDIYENVVRRD